MKISIVQLLRHPFRTINAHKELRYLAAGTASEAIEFFSFWILILAFPHSLYIMNSISFIFGVLSGFIFHKIWSFAGDHQFKTRYQLFGYLSLAAFNFVMINLLVGYFVRGVHIVPALAKLFAIAITVTWSYLLVNLVIFRHRSADQE